MKKLFLGIMLLALLTAFPFSAKAAVDVDVHIGIPLPPAIVFSAPPLTVVIPGTYIYAVPDVPQDIFFYGGWWWRPWEGRWYRSHHYDRGWASYKGAPSFYPHVPPRWRDDYRDRRWKGHPWNHQRVPAQQLQGNWKGWEKKKHWENQKYWGVPDMNPKKQKQHPSRSVHPSPPHNAPHDMNRHQPPPGHQDMHGPNSKQKHPEGKGKRPDHPQDKHGKGEGGHGNKHNQDQRE